MGFRNLFNKIRIGLRFFTPRELERIDAVKDRLDAWIEARLIYELCITEIAFTNEYTENIKDIEKYFPHTEDNFIQASRKVTSFKSKLFENTPNYIKVAAGEVPYTDEELKLVKEHEDFIASLQEVQ